VVDLDGRRIDKVLAWHRPREGADQSAALNQA
jgi:hypothetical protein